MHYFQGSREHRPPPPSGGLITGEREREREREKERERERERGRERDLPAHRPTSHLAYMIGGPAIRFKRYFQITCNTAIREGIT